jgi:hypothetical protein
MTISKTFFGFIASFVFSNISYAQGYPEFNGVYVGISGEYIQLSEASINTLQITEAGYERCPEGRFCPGSPGGIEGYRNFAGIAAYIQLQTVSSQQVLSSVSVPQNFESIFVRGRNPPQKIFYSYVSKYSDFMRTPDGQLLDETERPLEAAIFDRRREAGVFKYTTSPRQATLSGTYVLGDCGWDTSLFNVKIIDDTAVEFFLKDDNRSYRSPLVKRCGKDNTVETRNMAVSFGNKYYIINLESAK